MFRSTVPRPRPQVRRKAIIPLIYGLLCVCLTLAAGEGARAQTSDRAQGEKSRARLLAAGGLTQGRYLAGVEIRLAPGSLTYWKQPGDAGVPPTFSFEGSTNLASARPLFPAPRRYREAGAEAFGYMDDVLFPLVVTPVDPAKPVGIALKLDYATCDKLCLPAQATLQLELAPGAPESAEAPLLRAWVARTPRPASDPAAPRVAVTRAEAPDAWRLRFSGGAPDDLFVEGPQDWYFDTKRSAEGFDLILAQKPADAIAGPVEVILTMVVGDSAFEATTTLDAQRAKP